MFIALMARPEFFKKHLKMFIALAPVVYVHHINLDAINIITYNSDIRNSVMKAQGPEVAGEPLGFHPLLRSLAASNLGNGA